jgi:hypothetical protein
MCQRDGASGGVWGQARGQAALGEHKRFIMSIRVMNMKLLHKNRSASDYLTDCASLAREENCQKRRFRRCCDAAAAVAGGLWLRAGSSAASTGGWMPHTDNARGTSTANEIANQSRNRCGAVFPLLNFNCQRG